MNYAIRYYEGCRVMNYVDEIIIKYTHKSEELYDFVISHPRNQRIVVDITDIEDDIRDSISIFTKVIENHDRFAVKLSKNQNYESLKNMNIPFFFCEGVSTLKEALKTKERGVSDIYIVNELGFSLDKVKEICGEDINIRVYPNVAQRSKGIGNIISFFIRPEDIKDYEEEVGTVEFYGPLNRQAVLFDIYTSGLWLGDIADIILDFDGGKCDNKEIVTTFGEMRKNCHHICNTNRCSFCIRAQDIAEFMVEKGVKFRENK